MKTRHVIALLLIGTLGVTTILAQELKPLEKHKLVHKPTIEELKAMKISYLTEKLSLTPREAEQFWPIYNEFEDKKNRTKKVSKRQNKYQKRYRVIGC